MSLQATPSANRLHIGIFGRRNSGKSSLINALTGQETAIVSDVAGTTADPVYKHMEIHGIGPVTFIDTAGFDDTGHLGSLRVEQTRRAVERTDIALMVFGETVFTNELEWYELLKNKHIPVILIINKCDILRDTDKFAEKVTELFQQKPLIVSAKKKLNIPAVREALIRELPKDYEAESITGNLCHENDVVMLVMPQDTQAPKGRLILPQVQTIRELMDKKCIVHCITADKMSEGLQTLSAPPDLIITDSQVFRSVYENKPAESRLTSFSVLFAGYKGSLTDYVQGAYAIDRLQPDSKILIAEACTHAPLTEDIGREKIPALLRKRIGNRLTFDVVAGSDYPEDLTPYDLIIHCGGCMFNRKHILNRIERARQQQIPITNYGIAIAHLSGILDKIDMVD